MVMVLSGAENSFVCQGIGINTGPPVKCHVLPMTSETLADEAVFRKPQLSRSSMKSIFVQAGAPVLKPQTLKLLLRDQTMGGSRTCKVISARFKQTVVTVPFSL
ncbi:hypothetical protein SRHO_G00316440 [Serrasalmus rhombeus]